jgi:hypothetical protein
MLNRLIDHMITKEEHKLGTRLDYLRDIAGESESAFFKLALALPLARHRQVLPKTAYHLASIVSTQNEDCGECVEIAVQAARKDEVPAHYIRAALDHNYHLLTAALEEVCAFAEAMAQGSERADLREALRDRYGSKGLMELAFVIASSRLFPTLKRAMGRATAVTRQPQR